MPCMDGGPTPEEVARTEADWNTVQRLACEHCHGLEARGDRVPRWAKGWWQRHQKADALRTRESLAQLKAANRRRRALAKLTPEERKELGL